MKKEDLIALGIDEEIAKSVMALHGKTVTQLNAQVATAEQERDQFKEQLNSNGDATGLKDKEIKMIDNLLRNRCIELVCPIADSVQGGMPPYYTKDPLFGKATEVEDCIVFYNI